MKGTSDARGFGWPWQDSYGAMNLRRIPELSIQTEIIMLRLRCIFVNNLPAERLKLGAIEAKPQQTDREQSRPEFFRWQTAALWLRASKVLDH
jgi:hypothetical protein